MQIFFTRKFAKMLSGLCFCLTLLMRLQAMTGAHKKKSWSGTTTLAPEVRLPSDDRGQLQRLNALFLNMYIYVDSICNKVFFQVDPCQHFLVNRCSELSSIHLMLGIWTPKIFRSDHASSIKPVHSGPHWELHTLSLVFSCFLLKCEKLIHYTIQAPETPL